jgi:two-component system nitrate/nitrite response regulator NarL
MLTSRPDRPSAVHPHMATTARSVIKARSRSGLVTIRTVSSSSLPWTPGVFNDAPHPKNLGIFNVTGVRDCAGCRGGRGLQMSEALKILLLEDDGLVRMGMRELIHRAEPHAGIEEAASYEDAVRVLAGAPVDIAFLDVDLKGEKTGLDVLRHIRERQLATRVIMLSAHVEEQIVMGSIREGASGYIPKQSENRDVFRRALDTIFQGGIYLPAEAIGRGGFSPLAATAPAVTTLDEMGIRGRAVEALYYLCQGFSNQLIAYKMGVAESTVANDYNTKLFRAFRVTNRAALIVEVSRRGIIPPAPKAQASPAA